MASASAKLRALAETAPPIRTSPFIVYDSSQGVTEAMVKAQIRLMDALPAIIALVEAVEKEWEGDFASGEVGDALSALSQALGGK